MASEWALEQQKIQPNQNYKPVKVATPNKWRQLSTKMAKELQISRKRLVKAVKRGNVRVT